MTDLLKEEAPQVDGSLYVEDPVDPTKVNLSPITQSNMAAQASLIQGGDVAQTFSEMSQMGEEEKSLRMAEIASEARARKRSQALDLIATTLKGGGQSFEQQAGLVQAASETAPDSLTMAAEALYTTTTGEESDKQERRLATVGELIQPTVDLLATKQRVINAFSLSADGEKVSITNNPGDFLELLTPYLEQAYAAYMRDEVMAGRIYTPHQILETALLGETKANSREIYRSMRPDEKKEYLENAFRTFNAVKTFNVFNDNDLIQLDNIMSTVQHGYYTTGDRVLDDIGSVLDAIPLLNVFYRAILSPAAKAAKLATLNTMQKVGLRNTAAENQPVSVKSLAEQVNPDLARGMAKAISDDVTGETAEVLAGVERSEAELEMHGPQIPTPDGSVVAKPYAMDRRILEAAYGRDSKLDLSPSELARVAEKVDQGLGDTRNIVRSDEMSTSPVVLDNGDLSLSARYTSPEGGFHSAEEAIKTTLLELENYGLKESDITILQRKGDEYVPVSVKDVGAKKEIREALVKKKKALPEEFKKVNMQDDFIAQVDFTYSPRALDLATTVGTTKTAFIRKKKAQLKADKTGNWPPGKKEAALKELKAGKIPKVFQEEFDKVKDDKVVLDELDVKLNPLDTLSTKAPVPGESTPSRWLLPYGAMLDSRISQAGVAAVDRGNALQKAMADLFKEGVTEPLSKLPKAKAERLVKIFQDQTLARKKFSIEELTPLGVIDEAELTILENWKYVNDQRYWLANMDYNKTLINDGFISYVDDALDSPVIGRVMPNNAKRPKTVYDPASGKSRLTPEVWAEVENGGGKIVELRSPQLMGPKGDVEVSHIIVRGGDDSRRIKAIQETDRNLNYESGSSHINYKDPFFLERWKVDANGNEVPGSRGAIFTAPESTSARMLRERFEESNWNAGNGETWKYKERNAHELTSVELSKKNFEVTDYANLSSQKHKGQTLMSFDSRKPTELFPNLVDPIESFKHQTAELSRRIPMRATLERLERRILEQGKDFLPKNEWGAPRLPTAGEKFLKGDIVGTSDSRRMGDLKTMIEHYNYLKFGYLNGIDKGWKSGINMVSHIVGKASRRGERAIAAIGEEVPSLTGAIKGLAFNAHIALASPPSQWMVQGLPALMNLMLRPEYVMTGLARDMRLLKTAISAGEDLPTLEKIVGKKKAAEMMKIKSDWDKTGLEVGIDKHLLVEEGLGKMIATGRTSKVRDAHNAVVDKGRELGFDVGERFQLMTYWLAARNEAIKKHGPNALDNRRVAEEVRARTRTLTMNMNKAGEMPWNKNSLSLFLQFQISPYKALTMIADQSLTNAERVKIGTWQLLMMPLPTAVSAQIRASVGVEGTEGDYLTETISNGLVGGSFNTLMNVLYEDAGSASWERNVQLDANAAGPLTFLQELASDPQGVSVIQQTAQMSPGLSMVNPWGYNPIAFNLMKSFGSLIASPLDDEVDTLEQMKAMWHHMKQYSAAGRGYSAAYEEIFGDTLGERYSAISGKLQDGDVSFFESFARGVTGLGTTNQAIDRQLKIDIYSDTKDMRDDVDLTLSNLERQATILGYNVGDRRREEFIISRFPLAFPDGRLPPKVASYLLKQLRPDSTLVQKSLNNYGWGGDQAEKVADALGKSTPEIKSMYEYIKSEQAVNDLKEGM